MHDANDLFVLDQKFIITVSKDMVELHTHFVAVLVKVCINRFFKDEKFTIKSHFVADFVLRLPATEMQSIP